MRPPAPPDQATTQAELAELKTLAAQRNEAAQALVAYWDAGSPSYRWVEIALAQFKSKPYPNLRIARGMSLMNVAIYEAMVAAWQAKYLYNRPRPTLADPTLTTSVATPNSPSYPAEHAVAAGAAAAILGYLYPDEAQTFQAKDAVFGSWYDNASHRIFERHLDSNPPQAARIYALMGVAHYDAYIARWDAKYTYWSMRPYQVDPTVVTLLPPPPHPSYPSGHGCTMGAMAAILAHLFPEQADLCHEYGERSGRIAYLGWDPLPPGH